MAAKPGARFNHPRYIVGSPKAGTARPDVCTVTKVTKHSVYYRTETGMLCVVDHASFTATEVDWIED